MNKRLLAGLMAFCLAAGAANAAFAEDQHPQRGHPHRPAHRRGALPGTGRPVLAGLAASALQGGVTHATGGPSGY